jgi:hypothetical protein
MHIPVSTSKVKSSLFLIKQHAMKAYGAVEVRV